MADYSQYVSAAAKKYGVPEKLINQLINVESSGNASAVSKTGPVGLMQVSSAVAKEAGYSKQDMYDPEKNIDAGTKYLAKNIDAFGGNVTKALLGYNQGTGGAKQMLAGKVPMAKEGWNYIHNNKFSPEYLANNKVVPSYQDYMTPDTNALTAMGEQGVNPQQGNQYSNSAMFDTTPTEAQQTPEETETEKRLREGQKYTELKNQISKLFGGSQPQQQAPQVQAPVMQMPQQQAPQQLNTALFNSRIQQPQMSQPQQRTTPALVNILGGRNGL